MAASGAIEHMVRVGGRRLRLTNLEKVLYPATGTTKGEVIDYYTRIAPLLLPHVNGRPVTRKRWPDGVGTQEHPLDPFFAKHLEPGAPDWVARRPIEHSTGAKDYPLVADVATLVYLAQVASLELHVPQWRFTPDGEHGKPDRIVLDLDPGPGVGLTECAEVARWAREILDGMGLDAAPVTSGSKGIHLYAALPGDQTSDQISALARELARAIEADHSDLVVSQMAKSMRPGRVFIDWSQNNGAKTTIAPYSLRGRMEPTVAAPRTWEELADPGLRQLHFDEVLARTDDGDPMAALGFRAGARSAADGPLATYISMRDAARTPEPVPSNALAAPTPPDEHPRFVIQEHHASRLHYDLRLEHDGVFVSWAVPKGVPETTDRNHLAVMTEDHPLEYGTFEGEIPVGEYGAGSVTIWDDGRYDLEKWRDDEIIFTLDGRVGGPLGTVRLALIRTDGSGEKSTWLLHRMKDSGHSRTLPRGHVNFVSETPSTSPMLATASAAGLARAASQRWAEADGSRSAPAWAELKWDGVRAIGIWDGTRLTLRARSGNDITAKYPELTAVDARLGHEPAVIDGEIVALDAQGRPSFPLLQARMNLTKPPEIQRAAPRTPVQFYLFDVLHHGRTDAAALPLSERRRILEQLASEAIAAIVVPPVFDDVDDALDAGRRFGLEGVVVKDPRSTYRGGERSESWLKIKFSQTQEVVIGGIRPGRGGRSGAIGSLLVGVPGRHGLQYAGRVGSGFSDKTLAQLEAVLRPLRSEANPFIGVPAADASDALWVSPDQVGEVEFAEFTPGGILRQARWRGLRPDKSPDDVVREDGASGDA